MDDWILVEKNYTEENNKLILYNRLMLIYYLAKYGILPYYNYSCPFDFLIKLVHPVFVCDMFHNVIFHV